LWVIGVVAVMGFVFTSCQTGVTMWGECSNAPGVDTSGTDGHYVLLCEGGQWKPILTVRQYLAIVQHKPVPHDSLPTQPTLPGAGCYDSTHVDHGDIYFSGQLTADNARVLFSTDGSCTGAVAKTLTVVAANNWTDAQALCSSYGDRVWNYLGSSIGGLGYTGLTSMWGCA
jgi:hypothetical protein